jgi:hypothetical protein
VHYFCEDELALLIDGDEVNDYPQGIGSKLRSFSVAERVERSLNVEDTRIAAGNVIHGRPFKGCEVSDSILQGRKMFYEVVGVFDNQDTWSLRLLKEIEDHVPPITISKHQMPHGNAEGKGSIQPKDPSQCSPTEENIECVLANSDEDLRVFSHSLPPTALFRRERVESIHYSAVK